MRWEKRSIGKLLRKEFPMCCIFSPSRVVFFFSLFLLRSFRVSRENTGHSEHDRCRWQLHFERKAQSLLEIKFPTARPTTRRRCNCREREREMQPDAADAALQSVVWQSCCGRIDVLPPYISLLVYEVARSISLDQPDRQLRSSLASSAAHK